ncbi:unnamed protein product [marine sediment metagenome]|uniref:Uncharacterized protein n=1 Tax=marine sediment metagenome TaxID=412755 RepID=X1KVX1_9ZZZZ
MLTPEEYNHIIQNRTALADRIKDAKELGTHHRDLARSFKDDLDKLQLEMELYTNFLKDAIKEYEDAHPPAP